jgi:hypothetical protein
LGTVSQSQPTIQTSTWSCPNLTSASKLYNENVRPQTKPRAPSPGTGTHFRSQPRAHGRKPGENHRACGGDRAAIKAVVAPAKLEGEGSGLPCAVVDDDGRACGGVHGWQVRRVPTGSCLRCRRRRRRGRNAGHRGPPRSRPRSPGAPDLRRAEAGGRGRPAAG